MSTLMLLLACSSHVNQLQVLGGPIPANEEMVVAEPVFWEDHLDGDPFRTNAAVGNILFSGGYVTENDGRGMHNVSKNVEIAEQERYRRQVTDWLAGMLPSTVVAEGLVPPKTREVRGSQGGAIDGHDNASLPRLQLQPVAVGELPHPTLVPWVVSYYSHNAGWFYGQEFGTAAGARVRILLVAYGRDGRVLGHTSIDGSRISERVFSPSEPQLQDLLITLEKKVGKRIERAARL